MWRIIRAISLFSVTLLFDTARKYPYDGEEGGDEKSLSKQQSGNCEYYV